MDKNLFNSVQLSSQSCNLSLQDIEPPKSNVILEEEILKEQNTQEDIEILNKVKDESIEKFEVTDKKNLNDIKDEKNNAKNSKSYYVLKTIENPVNNETINKISNKSNIYGFWNLGVVSNYVMDGIKTICPPSGTSSKIVDKSSNKINKLTPKISTEIVNETNKQIKDDENNKYSKILSNDKTKSMVNDLNTSTYGYLPNWDSLVGATSNLMETTTSALKTATEVGIKNIKSLNKKVIRKNKLSNQVSYYSDTNLRQTSLKSAADYDYIDLVSLQSQLDENNNSKS
ncbi:Hypothetical protein SRAE_2000260800 [Strongyloides ratti]|uniref:Uncharacterized protein n=1 Tax=Strongyloides ratti TaxID=34506 RepID=A0A090LDV7_STRRB|nr:Hypothetical protein SRAE_2000260800 [Strongyloides ratti]CEF67947.1 Hypothetical protein SRAE_2000260800 [Strongyloides ratti]